MTRILVIALQEVTRELIDPWVTAGELPNLAALIQAGAYGHVHADAPLITPHSWANILTGVNAGRHGIFDYWQRGLDGRFAETTSASYKAAPLWSLLRGTGLRTTLLNLPTTWPPPELDGVVVAWDAGGAPERELFAPAALYDELMAAHGRYEAHATSPGGRSRREYIDLFDFETPRIAAAFEHLMGASDWDFCAAYFIDAAMAQHYFWAEMEADDEPYRDVVLSAYRNLDAAVGRLARAAGRDALVFVLSECGAGGLRSGINLNNWLQQQGWYARRKDPLRGPRRFVDENLLPAAKRALPSAVKAMLGTAVPGLKNWASSSGTRLDADWSRTRIFSRGKEGNLFVNLVGRDPYGVVASGAEYEQLLADVTGALRELRDPASGECVVHNVLRPSQLFDGPESQYAPDLIVDWTEGAYMTTERNASADEVFTARWRKGMSWPTTGSHRHDGAIIAAGPGVAAGGHLGTVSHFDLLPTWLNRLDQPLPPELQGHAIDGIAK